MTRRFPRFALAVLLGWASVAHAGGNIQVRKPEDPSQIVSAHVAAAVPAVTHIGVLAGGGPTQLYDLAELARQGHFFAGAGNDPEERVRKVYEGFTGEWHQ